MKILRIDNQGAFNDCVYNNKTELREQLIDMHGSDMANDEDRDALQKWSLTEVCEMFDWDYEIITNKEAKLYE